MGTFPAARSVFIFGSFFLSRARISRILWTLVWLANWSHQARLSCDCTFSSLGWKTRHTVVCKRTVLINLGLTTLPVFKSILVNKMKSYWVNNLYPMKQYGYFSPKLYLMTVCIWDWVVILFKHRRMGSEQYPTTDFRISSLLHFHTFGLTLM